MIALETAGQLLDFGARVSKAVADQQLAGAVALHNILAKERVAYLADEVGMGKTYVALGALALFRHFDPTFRVLIIAPRENLQAKWKKELENFVAHCVKFPDLRVKAAHGRPAKAVVLCRNLADLAREASSDPDRDFIARMSSFSFQLGQDPAGWRTKRAQLLEQLPWLDPELFDLRRKDVFKESYAAGLCCALPEFDLVVIDEAHNLKHGFESGAARNRVLGLTLGRGPAPSEFRGYGPRARRLLLLSATPVETDFAQLWNQLDVLGVGGEPWDQLKSAERLDAEKRDLARRFLVRRVASLKVGEQELTKNLYRREWREGGVDLHDEPLEVSDPRALLAVALVQKKVSELIGERFNNQFQIGMLASFESFYQTAGVRVESEDEDAANFDAADQAESEEERIGIDVASINRLARSHRRRFDRELPHPKMDGVVQSLSRAFETGEKHLVFVRRIASVKEIQRKLEDIYDEHLFHRLRNHLAPVRDALEPLFEQYRALHREQRDRNVRLTVMEQPQAELVDDVEPEHAEDEDERDDGGVDTFFAWFFRGGGPERTFSGATLQKRLNAAAGQYATLFEENHVALLLGVSPGLVFTRLREHLGDDSAALEQDLATRASRHLPNRARQPRRNVFLAVQRAALELISERDDELAAHARVILRERHPAPTRFKNPAKAVSEIPDWLAQRTLFTELRARPQLAARLLPEPGSHDFRTAFREHELRRELFASMCRLGSPLIDLYVLAIRRRETLRLGVREEDTDDFALGNEFLNLLEQQAEAGPGRFSAFSELADAAAAFHTILDVNLPRARDIPLSEAGRELGQLLRAQQPLGGMFGQINTTLVRQFRMPGYPLILVTTDLLQEGEDLHTFCSSVHHYGISWMPSAMEQRTGRVDRVGSQTERRLARLSATVSGEDKLQVYYPHLRETVELLQVRVVLERLKRFMQLMHEDLGALDEGRGALDVSKEILKLSRDLAPSLEPLRSAFPVRDEWLKSAPSPLAVEPSLASDATRRFAEIAKPTLGGIPVTWEPHAPDGTLLGTAQLGARQQPFTLLLRSVAGRPLVRCVSPVGLVAPHGRWEEIELLGREIGVRLGATHADSQFDTYDLTAEGDVLLGPVAYDMDRIGALVRRVVTVADRIEEQILEQDTPLDAFREDFGEEATFER